MDNALSDHLQFVKSAVDAHTAYWADQKQICQNLTSIYETRFFSSNRRLFPNTMHQVETADAYGYVESMIGSLFVRAPAIQIKPDPLTPGQEVRAVQELVNRYLDRKHRVVQDASRLALIYPNSFIKLAPRASTDPLERVGMKAIAPWDVIVDMEAESWECQRYVGHIYFLPIADAQERFGKRNFKGVEKEEYFEPEKLRQKASGLKSMLYVRIVEFYNLLNNTVYFWSEQYKDGQEFIEHADIPITDFDGAPLPPIVPLYFSASPHKPLQGYSALSRIYDQLVEKNFLRTTMANSVRRDGRQFLYNKEKVDELTLTGLSTGQDGLLIPVEGDLSNVVVPLVVPPVNADHERYMAQIESDLAKGSIMAPFTRGEATKATATEVTLLQQYASSEIGRQARARDEAIERVANIYIRMLATVMEPDDAIQITVDGAVEMVKGSDFEGKYVIQALDQANSPVADALRQQQLVSLGPLLVQLGADPDKIREEIVRAYRLPLHLAEKKAEVEPVVPAVRGMTEAQAELLQGREARLAALQADREGF